MIEDQLLAELAALRAEVHGLRDKVASLELENTTLSDNQLIQLRLIHELKEKAKRSPGKTELSRAEKIERYLAARPDHKATFETLKGYLQLDNVRLNEAITTLMSTHPGSYTIQKAQTGDKRKKILIMLPK
jgi:predicted nuclease with TOPRIM domain